MINKKDIMRLNQEIGEAGEFHNESSLDFALHIIRERKDWRIEFSYLVRSILVDHVFRDGNKRTSLGLLIYYARDKQITYDVEKLLSAITSISAGSITDINEIERRINHGFIY